jgi:hypothetical protein
MRGLFQAGYAVRPRVSWCYAEVRRVARDRDVTVTSVIEKSLRAELRRMQSSEAKAAYRIRPLKGRGLKAGIDLDDNADLMARMERVDAT